MSETQQKDRQALAHRIAAAVHWGLAARRMSAAALSNLTGLGPQNIRSLLRGDSNICDWLTVDYLADIGRALELELCMEFRDAPEDRK